MSFHIDELQAAIKRTEQAMERQTAQLASRTDRDLAEIATRNLEMLGELLAIQRRILADMLRQGEVGST